MRKSWPTMAAVAALLLLGTAAGARADIIIDNEPPFPSVTDENIVFAQPGVTTDVGMTVTGVTNNTGALFSFTENNDILRAPSSGQARVEGEFGDFDYLLIDAVNPTTYFTAFEANVNLSDTAQIRVTVENSTGGSETLVWSGGGAGSNFFTVFTQMGQLINTVLIESLVSDFIVDVRQVRVGGIQTQQVVPEPASLLLFGTGLVGLSAAFRRRVRARTLP